MADLAKDIIKVLEGAVRPSSQVGDPETWAKAAVQMAQHTASPFQGRKETGPTRLKDKILWASELGEECHRKLWYKFHKPQTAEPLSGATKFKFTYGNIIEEMALVYAKAAGYEVRDQQALLTEKLPNGWLVRGRIDAAIEAPDHSRFVLDSKSCSSAAFQKYSRTMGLTPAQDSFGYIQQLSFYDTNRNQLSSYREGDFWGNAQFLFIDKQLGRMRSMSYQPPGLLNYSWIKGTARFDLEMTGSEAPERGHMDVPEGTSGNMRLGVACSYCPFKAECWPGLRAFKYSTGPTFLTKVVKTPHVLEIPLTGEEG